MILSKKNLSKLLLAGAVIGMVAAPSVTHLNSMHTGITTEVHAAAHKVYNTSNKGTIVLERNTRVEDAKNGNNASIIPKGQVVHYLKHPEGYVLYNNKYHYNTAHAYEIAGDTNPFQDNIKHQRYKKVTPKAQGNNNIKKQNLNLKKRKLNGHLLQLRKEQEAKKLAAEKNANKKGLPKTSDHNQSKVLYATAITVLAIVTGLLVRVIRRKKV